MPGKVSFILANLLILLPLLLLLLITRAPNVQYCSDPSNRNTLGATFYVLRCGIKVRKYMAEPDNLIEFY